MKIIKETTLHPEGNDGVDLYPKTSINQVEILPQKLTYLETQVSQLNANKLTKPTNPSAESAVTMLADGTVGTKLLSEIGGGGKLYRHDITFQKNSSNDIVTMSFIDSSNINLTVTEIYDKHNGELTGYASIVDFSQYFSSNGIVEIKIYKLDEGNVVFDYYGVIWAAPKNSAPTYVLCSNDTILLDTELQKAQYKITEL